MALLRFRSNPNRGEIMKKTILSLLVLSVAVPGQLRAQSAEQAVMEVVHGLFEAMSQADSAEAQTASSSSLRPSCDHDNLVGHRKDFVSLHGVIGVRRSPAPRVRPSKRMEGCAQAKDGLIDRYEDTQLRDWTSDEASSRWMARAIRSTDQLRWSSYASPGAMTTA